MGRDRTEEHNPNMRSWWLLGQLMVGHGNSSIRRNQIPDERVIRHRIPEIERISAFPTTLS
jgi:hypothetical protein